jgi:hypothetical protein
MSHHGRDCLSVQRPPIPVRVAAFNGAGEGPPSEAAEACTPRPPPPPPSGVRLSAPSAPVGEGRLSAVLQWDAPVEGDTDAPECAAHEVEWVEAEAGGASASRQSCSGRAAEFSVPGLLPGTEYQVGARY